MPGLFDSGGGPDFSLAGMILGGRGYASNWFQQRDQMLWQQAAQARQDAAEKQYGAALMNSPQYQQFRDKPMDRKAALDFWASNIGAPGDIDTQGASYVGTSLSAQYNKVQSDVNLANQLTVTNLQDQQQKENLHIASDLNKSETDYRNQQDLELYKQKAQFDSDRKQAVINSLANVPGEVAANIRFDTAFPGVRQPDQSVGFDAAGGFYMRPATGSADHIKMMSQLTAGETLVDQLSGLSTQLERGDYTTAGWNATQANLMLTAKGLFEAGALDQGTLDVLAKAIPTMNYITNKEGNAARLEMLRNTILQIRERNKNVIETFSTPVGDLPKGKGAAKYFPEPDKPVPAQGSVTKAQKAIENQPSAVSKPRQEMFNAAPGPMGGY